MVEGVVKNYYEGEAQEYNREFYIAKGGYPTLQYRHKYMLEMALQLDLPRMPGFWTSDAVPAKWCLT